MMFKDLPKSLQSLVCFALLICFVSAMLIYMIVLIPLLPCLAMRNAVRWLRMPKLERVRRREAEKAACMAFSAKKGEKPRGETVIEYNDDHCIAKVWYVNDRLSSYAYFCYSFEQKSCVEINYYRRDQPL
jgi:hypothetical protein